MKFGLLFGVFSFIIFTLSFTSVFSLFLGNLVLLYQDLVLALFSNKEREKKPQALSFSGSSQTPVLEMIYDLNIMSLCLIDKFFS